MAIKGMLAAEQADARAAADATVHGRSITGFSRATEDPIAGRRVGAPEIQRLPAGPPVAPDAAAPQPKALPRTPDMPDRKPFGTMTQRLAVAKRPGYRRCWINDEPGRIDAAKAAGYTHVIDPKTGEPTRLIVNRGENNRGEYGYLMEMPMAWYQADKQAEQDQRDRFLADIRTGRSGPGAEDNRYIPEQGIRIETG